MMIAASAAMRPRTIIRLGRSPKGILLLLFSALLAVAATIGDPALVWPPLFVAAACAAAVDVGIVYATQRRWIVPDGAVLTGLIVAMVLRPQESLLVVGATASVAIVSKHLFRTRWSNIFNPAALAIVASSLALQTGQSWWGALPDLGVTGVAVLLSLGGFIVTRINKVPMVLVFLLTYFLLFAVASFFKESALVGEIFRSPDLHAALFFAFFMLDDPPTSPVRYEDQVVYGILVAAASYLVFMAVGAVYFLAAGLLLGNAWESARRCWQWSRRQAAR